MWGNYLFRESIDQIDFCTHLKNVSKPRKKVNQRCFVVDIFSDEYKIQVQNVNVVQQIHHAYLRAIDVFEGDLCKNF